MSLTFLQAIRVSAPELTLGGCGRGVSFDTQMALILNRLFPLPAWSTLKVGYPAANKLLQRLIQQSDPRTAANVPLRLLVSSWLALEGAVFVELPFLLLIHPNFGFPSSALSSSAHSSR